MIKKKKSIIKYTTNIGYWKKISKNDKFDINQGLLICA